MAHSISLTVKLCALLVLVMAGMVLSGPAGIGPEPRSAEARGPKVATLGLRYHDFGLGSSVTVTLDREPNKAHFRPGPDSNHGPIVLNDGDTLFVEVDSGDIDIGSRTQLAIADPSALVKIHTSCSRPLEGGFFYGPDDDDTAEDFSEFGGSGFQFGFEVIELVLSSEEPSDNCVPATPTPDSDGDGVPDDEDACPGTPAGAAVDANGCTPTQGTENLLAAIDSFGLPNGVANSLTASLNQATANLNNGNPNDDVAVCGMLTAFIGQVDAKEGNGQLTATQADELRQAAEMIKAALGCS